MPKYDLKLGREDPVPDTTQQATLDEGVDMDLKSQGNILQNELCCLSLDAQKSSDKLECIEYLLLDGKAPGRS